MVLRAAGYSGESSTAPLAKNWIYCLFSPEPCWDVIQVDVEVCVDPLKTGNSSLLDWTVLFIVCLISNWVKCQCCYTQITSPVPNFRILSLILWTLWVAWLLLILHSNPYHLIDSLCWEARTSYMQDQMAQPWQWWIILAQHWWVVLFELNLSPNL